MDGRQGSSSSFRTPQRRISSLIPANSTLKEKISDLDDLANAREEVRSMKGNVMGIHSI